MLIVISAFTISSFSSCDKDDNDLDFTNPENLSGTTWKTSDYHPDSDEWEYAALKFKTTSALELWAKVIGQDEEKHGNCTYTIEGSNIKIVADGVPLSEWYMEGTINAQEMELSIYDEGMFFVTWVFTKQ